MITNVKEQFVDVIKAESKGKNTLILRRLKTSIKRFDGKVASYELEYRWHNMVIDSDNMPDVHRVRGNEFSYWLKKEINFEKGLFEQFNVF